MTKWQERWKPQEVTGNITIRKVCRNMIANTYRHHKSNLFIAVVGCLSVVYLLILSPKQTPFLTKILFVLNHCRPLFLLSFTKHSLPYSCFSKTTDDCRCQTASNQSLGKHKHEDLNSLDRQTCLSLQAYQ